MTVPARLRWLSPVGKAVRPAPTTQADVCLIVEGCYPFIAGGVSSWVDWLMRTQPQLRFAVVAIVSNQEPREIRYKFPDNLVQLSELTLHGGPMTKSRRPPALSPGAGEELAQNLIDLARGGGLAEFGRIVEIVNGSNNAGQSPALSMHDLLQSSLSLDLIRRMYDEVMPHASFLQFYWAWRALFGGLFSVMKFELPRAQAYHAISTGYAGLLAARATLETGRPAAITEHGIYTNERRIEILMAGWISDSVEKGLAIDDPRMDLRDLWISAFEGYARTCYQACAVITTLYRDNQQLQRALGAAEEKLLVIANGIAMERFEKLSWASPEAQPTMALIGRVVPIKDIKTFIAAAALVRQKFPNLRVLVLGPTNEDPAYFEECRQLVAELDLSGCFTFTGNVQIAEWMPSIHVVVLTSLSEAQPLVLLEAGAAGIPCVATNVGSCREMIEGQADADGTMEPGGFVTDLVAPDQVADGVCQLLASEDLRRRHGEAMRKRVRNSYHSDMAQRQYATLYRDLMAAPTSPHARECG